MEGSGHIDATVLRDADDPEVFASAADDVLESRKYCLQRWCADVVAVIDSKADPIEYVRYSAYGVPYVYAAGDMNRDGVCDSADEDAWNDLWNSGTGTGYAGCEWDPVVSVDHVRQRVYLPEMGRWGRRDPAGYTGSNSLLDYVGEIAVGRLDPSGMVWRKCCAQANNVDCDLRLCGIPSVIDYNANDWHFGVWGDSVTPSFPPGDDTENSPANVCQREATTFAQTHAVGAASRCYDAARNAYLQACLGSGPNAGPGPNAVGAGLFALFACQQGQAEPRPGYIQCVGNCIIAGLASCGGVCPTTSSAAMGAAQLALLGCMGGTAVAPPALPGCIALGAALGLLPCAECMVGVALGCASDC